MRTVQFTQQTWPVMRFARVAIVVTTLCGSGVAPGVSPRVLRCAEPTRTVQADLAVEATVLSRVPAKVRRYVDRLLQRRDLDGDGRLSADEWQQMSGEASQIDVDADTLITHHELLLHVGRYGLARMPVRLLPPTAETVIDPAVTLQSPTLEADGEPNTTDEGTASSSEADGDSSQ